MKIQKRGQIEVKDVDHKPRNVTRWQEMSKRFQSQAEAMDKLGTLFKKEK